MPTPSIVGSNDTTFTSATNPTIPYTPVAAGNALIVVVTTFNDRSITSITDDMSAPTTYSSVVNQLSTTECWIYLGNNITDTDLTTITVNFSVSATGSITVIEVQDLDDSAPNDVSSSVANSSVDPAAFAASGAIDTTTDVCVVAAFRPTSAVTFNGASGFTRYGGGTGTTYWVGAKTSAGALTDEGSTNNTLDLSATRSGPGVIASFKAPAGGGGSSISNAVRRQWLRRAPFSTLNAR